MGAAGVRFPKDGQREESGSSPQTVALGGTDSGKAEACE